MEKQHSNEWEDGSLEKLFGRALQKLRKERGLSQEKLSFESGVHRTYISLLERGKRCPSLKTIFQLSKALAVEPADLLDRVQRLEVDISRKAESSGLKPE